MKDTIKQIIESNLPEERTEKKNHTPNCLRGTDKYNHAYCEISVEDDGFNQALSQIDTSLIADEVLKVVKNEMHEELNKYLCENLDLNNLGNEELRNDILQLLSNLSTNKENENNE